MSTDAPIDLDLVISDLWDLGTTGVHHSDDGVVVAGFPDQESASAAVQFLLGRPDLRPDPGSVVIEPAPGPEAAGPGDGPKQVVVAWPDGPSIGGPDSLRLTIDAGGAFGHGTHPTTAACLDLLLAAIARPTDSVGPPSMLDVGTGTGVLAIAAAMAGADPVAAVDNDLHAVETARANIEVNGVEVRCHLGSVDTVGGIHDLVAVNVLAPVHQRLASAVVAATATGGCVVTGGYLDNQAEAVVAHYRAAAHAAARSVSVVAVDRRDGWVAQTLTID